MKSLRIIVPLGVTAIITVLAILAALWLASMVPAGEWSQLLKAGIVIFVIGTIFFVIAWSAYFSHIIRQSIEKSLSEKN